MISETKQNIKLILNPSSIPIIYYIRIHLSILVRYFSALVLRRRTIFLVARLNFLSPTLMAECGSFVACFADLHLASAAFMFMCRSLQAMAFALWLWPLRIWMRTISPSGNSATTRPALSLRTESANWMSCMRRLRRICW